MREIFPQQASKKRKLSNVVLCYHGCVLARADALIFRQHIDDVKNQVIDLLQAGYQFVAPSEYDNWYEGAPGYDGPLAVIHLDDGLDSIIPFCEWLIEQQLPFGVAVISSRNNKYNPQQGFLRWSTLRAWVESGYCEILRHTHNIHNLTISSVDGYAAPVLEGPCWIDEPANIIYKKPGDSRWYWDFDIIDKTTWGFPLFGSDPYSNYTTPISSDVYFVADTTTTVTIIRFWAALHRPAGAGYTCNVEILADGVSLGTYTITPKNYETRSQWVEREFYTLLLTTPFDITSGNQHHLRFVTQNTGSGCFILYMLPDVFNAGFYGVTSCISLTPGKVGNDFADFPAGRPWPGRAGLILASGSGRQATMAEYQAYIQDDVDAQTAAIENWLKADWYESQTAVNWDRKLWSVFPLCGSVRDSKLINSMLKWTADRPSGFDPLATEMTIESLKLRLHRASPRYAMLVLVSMATSIDGPWTDVAEWVPNWAEYKWVTFDIKPQTVTIGQDYWFRFSTMNISYRRQNQTMTDSDLVNSVIKMAVPGSPFDLNLEDSVIYLWLDRPYLQTVDSNYIGMPPGASDPVYYVITDYNVEGKETKAWRATVDDMAYAQWSSVYASMYPGYSLTVTVDDYDPLWLGGTYKFYQNPSSASGMTAWSTTSRDSHKTLVVSSDSYNSQITVSKSGLTPVFTTTPNPLSRSDYLASFPGQLDMNYALWQKSYEYFEKDKKDKKDKTSVFGDVQPLQYYIDTYGISLTEAEKDDIYAAYLAAENFFSHVEYGYLNYYGFYGHLPFGALASVKQPSGIVYDQMIYPFGSFNADATPTADIKPVQDISTELASVFDAAGIRSGYTIWPSRNDKQSRFREPFCRCTTHTKSRMLLYGDVLQENTRSLIANYTGLRWPDAGHGGLKWQIAIEPDNNGNATVRNCYPALDTVAFDAYFFRQPDVDHADGWILTGALNDGGTYDSVVFADDKTFLRDRGVHCSLIISNYDDLTGDVSPTIASYVVNNADTFIPLITTIAADWDGITCNLEGIPQADRAAATAFYQDLGRALRAIGKQLHITAPALTNTDYDIGSEWWWGWCDHAAIIGYVDRMKIMSYTETGPGTPPGPHAPDFFFEAAYRYIANTIPPEHYKRILVGVNAFGHIWQDPAGTVVDYGSSHACMAEAITRGAKIGFADGEAYFYYKQMASWWSTPATMNRAVDIASRYGFGGLGVWKGDDGDIDEHYPHWPQIGVIDMTSFIDMRFPDDIRYGFTGGPMYKVDVGSSDGGGEQRNLRWDVPLYEYSADIRLVVEQHGNRGLDDLIAFFRLAKGRYHSFRFKDWADYKAVDSFIGTGNGTQTAFQLRKAYQFGSEVEYRTITKPVLNSVVIKINGAVMSSGYSINYTSGVITFSSPVGNGDSISASFEFDVQVRFNIDKLPVTINNFNTIDATQISLIEVRE